MGNLSTCQKYVEKHAGPPPSLLGLMERNLESLALHAPRPALLHDYTLGHPFPD